MFVVLLSLSGGFLLLAVFFAYQASEPGFFKSVVVQDSLSPNSKLDQDPAFLLNPESRPRFSMAKL
jgi:hypothetical protein